MSKCDNCPGIGSFIVMVLGAIVLGFLLYMSGYANASQKFWHYAAREGYAQWVVDEPDKGHFEWIKK